MISTQKRRLLLIDADNVEIQSWTYARRQINYRKLLHEVGHGQFIRPIYYRPEKGFPNTQRAALEKAGLQVCPTTKNSDPWFIVDAVYLAHDYDAVVFVGGDGDLAPVIEKLQTRRIRVEVWSWLSTVSRQVRLMADRFVPLDGLGIERRPKNRNGTSPNGQRKRNDNESTRDSKPRRGDDDTSADVA